MNTSKRKLATACVAGVAALALVCVGAYALVPAHDLTVSASVEETEDCLKVYIGNVDDAPEGYTQQRAKYVEKVTKADSDEVMKAVIGLDDYYTIEDITEWAKDYDITIGRAYMWPKGETGRLSLYVENGDLQASLETYIQQVQEEGFCEGDEQFAKDFQRLMDGEYEVFALTVTAPASALKAASTEADCVSYVDVMYNAEAEKYAKKVKKAVSYIELPAKPDGAL